MEGFVGDRGSLQLTASVGGASTDQGEPTSKGEILAIDWFAPDALPANTSPSTRRRIAEALHAMESDPNW